MIVQQLCYLAMQSQCIWRNWFTGRNCDSKTGCSQFSRDTSPYKPGTSCDQYGAHFINPLYGMKSFCKGRLSASVGSCGMLAIFSSIFNPSDSPPNAIHTPGGTVNRW